ncbi:MAG: PEP-CTERM sorting domain-containing protein [Planctomycetota bacterium]
MAALVSLVPHSFVEEEMSKLTLTLAASAATLGLAGAVSAAPIVFDDFNTGGGGTFIDNQASGTTTVGDVTLSLAVTSSGTFESTSTGTGIDAPGGGDSPLQVDGGESFSISFDVGGTLDEIVAFQFPGTSTVTFTNSETGFSDEVTFIEDDNSGQTTNVAALDLAFDAGDVINVTTVGTTVAGLSSGYRFNSFTITPTPIPEPTSALAIAAGGLLLAARRRRT